MKPNDIPFNIAILDQSKTRLPVTRKVKTRDIYDGATRNLHNEGLFSTEIFGRVGSRDRMSRFGYIDLNTTIIHPFLFRTLARLKGLYRGIMEGRSFAKWDAKLKDFVQSDEVNGETGMAFFFRHMFEIEFKLTGSDIQAARVKFVKNNLKKALQDQLWVMPAGYREVRIDGEGRTEENEVNDFYRQVYSISDTLPPRSYSAVVDTSRYAVQRKCNELYAHFESLMSGKRGIIRSKYGKRSITNGTRNVLTSQDTGSAELGSPVSVGVNHTTIGLYQAMNGILPVTKYHLRNGWIKDLFYPDVQMALLVNPKTLKQERVTLKTKEMDRWTSSDGIEKIIKTMQEPELRHRPILVGGMYLGLMYNGPDGTYRIFGDIDELPEHLSKEHVHPLTYMEWMYTALKGQWGKYPIYVTRYPTAGEGSTYPSLCYVRTTINSELREELGDDWQRNGILAISYPKFGETDYFDTMSPSPSRLEGLAGDFDGDTGSGNIGYDNRTIAQVHEYFTTRAAYIEPSGSLRASPFDYLFDLCAANMTGAHS